MSGSDDVEAAVTAAFGAAFPDARLSGESDFYALGGDSIQALEISRHLEATLGRDVHPSLLLHHPSVAELTAALAGA